MTLIKVFFFLITNCCLTIGYAQYTIDTVKFKNYNTNNQYELSVKKEVYIFIDRYIDSLKNCDSILPRFLEDRNFDLNLYTLPLCHNTYISLRYLIFENINDFKILSKIINSKNKKYFLSPKFKRDIPFKEYSNQQLAKMRYDYLLNKLYLQGSQ